MIWMELTRTDVVFNRLSMVLFMCRNISSRNDLKLHGTSFWKILKILEEKSTSGGPHPVHEGGGAPYPPGRAPCLMGPLTLHRPQLQLHIFVFGEKISERRIHRVLWYRAAAASCSSLGGLICSPFRAPERGIRSHHHHQPSSITDIMMPAAVHE